ncbi:MAG: alkylphosphonate utilization protein [Myxococcales bacterium]|nr:alkylphosphonate utilization protein [Myxococcales bacterium]
MTTQAPESCPQCHGDNLYPDGALTICADCGFELDPSASTSSATDDDGPEFVVRDANGTPLADGDSVVLVKSLPVKGSSVTLKQGTKVKNIRLVPGDHGVDCRVDGMSLMLKAEFLRKA